jgi:magnesium chelatase subunit H
MKMLRQIPKLLRFIPGKAQDVRAYFLTLQYWLAGSDENVAQHGAPSWSTAMPPARARHLRGVVKAAPPVVYPDVGLYHPRSEEADRPRRPGPPATGGRAARVGSSSCAPTCWRATPRIMTA